MQDQISKTEKFLETIYNGINTAIFVIDVTEKGEFRFAGLNPAHERVSGMLSKEVQGKTIDELDDMIPKEAIKVIKGNYQRCLDANNMIEYEEMIPMKGKIIWWHTTLNPIRNEKGKIIGIIGSASDITELKTISEKLYNKNAELENLYKKIKKDLSDTLVNKSTIESILEKQSTDLQERENELLCQFNIDKFSLEEVFSKERFITQSAKDIKSSFLNYKDIEVKIETDGYTFETNAGTNSKITISASAIYNKTKVSIFVFYVGNKTKKPFIQQDENLIKSLSIKISRVISTNRLIHALQKKNEEYLSLLEEFKSQNEELITTNEQLEKINEENQKLQDELRMLNTDLEKKVEKRTKSLEEANNELASFSYSVSHDLRTPLRAITGYSEILLEDFEDKIDEDMREVVDVIIRNTRRMSVLIDSILEFSRLGRVKITPKAIDMKRVFEDSYQNMLAINQDKDIKLSKGKIYPAYGDLKLIRSVVENIMSNAVKYSQNEKIVEIEIASEKNNQHIIYSIKDNGAGFDMQYYDKLFGVFQRLHSDREFKGSGVGMAFAKRIIEKHHGNIWAESEPGKGATFFFSLPINDSAIEN